MKNNVIQRVIILGAIAIIGILGIQSYWLIKSWNLSDEDFHQRVHISLRHVAQSLSVINDSELPTIDLIKRVSSNYYVVNINSKIDANDLEYYLIKEFQALSLNTDFEYAIHSCETSEMVYGNYCGYADSQLENKADGDLPKYDEFIYYFGVKFPSKTQYLFGRMQVSMILFGILLMTIFFFAYAIYVILSQKRLSELQNDFINNMTHEFKTPIATIKLSSDVFLKNDLIQGDKRLFKYAKIIKAQNERLNKQVEKVLQIAKMEKNSFTIKKERLDIHELIENVVNSMEPTLAESNGKIEVDFKLKSPFINADRFHTLNILHNLIDNAIKYSKVNPHIIIKTYNENNCTIISIQDNGIGVGKDNLTKIFDKFYRVPTGNVHNVKGFGLGLFYVKNICNAHDWEISAHSTLGEGTTFKIVIKC